MEERDQKSDCDEYPRAADYIDHEIFSGLEEKGVCSNSKQQGAVERYKEEQGDPIIPFFFDGCESNEKS